MRHDLAILTLKTKTNTLLKNHGFQQSEFPSNLWKQVIYTDGISAEIANTNASTNVNIAKNQVTRNIVSSKILKKCRLLKYATKKTGTSRNKLSRLQSKFISFNKKQHKGHIDAFQHFI